MPRKCVFLCGYLEDIIVSASEPPGLSGHFSVSISGLYTRPPPFPPHWLPSCVTLSSVGICVQEEEDGIDRVCVRAREPPVNTW